MKQLVFDTIVQNLFIYFNEVVKSVVESVIIWFRQSLFSSIYILYWSKYGTTLFKVTIHYSQKSVGVGLHFSYVNTLGLVLQRFLDLGDFRTTLRKIGFPIFR